METPTWQDENKMIVPARVRFFRGQDGSLKMTAEANRSFLRVRVSRAFPLSDPNHFIGLRDGGDGEIGVVEDLRQLAPDQKALVEEELEKRYFVPVVHRINDIKEEFGIVTWDVETDRGPKRYTVRGLKDNVHEQSDARLLVTDVDGNRFEVTDYTLLDVRSQSKLDLIL
ncbi:MAG: DUF1854 domain-containing protein [Armatimonadetes bacterium]|nr:DUF1854 domain-containing protein [Armatimonadota bacterium]